MHKRTIKKLGEQIEEGRNTVLCNKKNQNPGMVIFFQGPGALHRRLPRLLRPGPGPQDHNQGQYRDANCDRFPAQIYFTHSQEWGQCLELGEEELEAECEKLDLVKEEEEEEDKEDDVEEDEIY